MRGLGARGHTLLSSPLPGTPKRSPACRCTAAAGGGGPDPAAQPALQPALPALPCAAAAQQLQPLQLGKQPEETTRGAACLPRAGRRWWQLPSARHLRRPPRRLLVLRSWCAASPDRPLRTCSVPAAGVRAVLQGCLGKKPGRPTVSVAACTRRQRAPRATHGAGVVGVDVRSEVARRPPSPLACGGTAPSHALWWRGPALFVARTGGE